MGYYEDSLIPGEKILYRANRALSAFVLPMVFVIILCRTRR